MFSGGSGDNKSRQSSGGRSFFGRRKDKYTESKAYDDGASLYPGPPSGSASTVGSKSSRHSRNDSEQDYGPEVDTNGLAMQAGVITSIPYDSLSSSNKTPIPVDYLPKNEQTPARKEKDVTPHQLNKGTGDFHQYPSWEPQVVRMPSSTLGGPRPLPPTQAPMMSSVSSRERQQSKSGAGMNGYHATNSYSTAESSNPRNSFDQMSIHSTMSTATRGSSIFSSDNTSRTAIPSYVHDNTLRPTSSHSSVRQTNAHASYNSSAAFSPEGFSLQRPKDDQVVEQMFSALMLKRGWQNLPEGAKRQMMAYPPNKKWTLIYQDRLTEYQGEQKRRNTRQTGNYGGMGDILARADEEGSPEWYVKKILDDSITSKQLASLSVSLRTQPIK